MFRKLSLVTAAAGAALVAPMVSAQSMVSEDVTDAIDQVSTDIVTVGTAIIAVAAVVMAFRWVKAAFF